MRKARLRSEQLRRARTGKAARVLEVAEKLTSAFASVEERRFQRRVRALEIIGLQPSWVEIYCPPEAFPRIVKS